MAKTKATGRLKPAPRPTGPAQPPKGKMGGHSPNGRMAGHGY